MLIRRGGRSIYFDNIKEEIRPGYLVYVTSYKLAPNGGDLNDIAKYISKDSLRYAKLTIKTLFLSTDILANTPKIGRIVPEFNNSLIRELIRGNYRIVYLIVSSKRIDIITVHHSARQLSAESV